MESKGPGQECEELIGFLRFITKTLLNNLISEGALTSADPAFVQTFGSSFEASNHEDLFRVV